MKAALLSSVSWPALRLGMRAYLRWPLVILDRGKLIDG